MDLSAIMASKLFRTSPRQSDILRKISSSNSGHGLKVQKPYQVNVPKKDDDIVEEGKSDVKRHEVSTDVADSDEGRDNESGTDVKTRPASNMAKAEPSSSEAGVSFKRDTQESGTSEPGESSVGVEPSGSDSSENEAGSEVSVTEASSVVASAGTPLPTVDVTDRMDLEVDDIKMMLNSDSITEGVTRVRTKGENEVWVYYNDNVNLNDVMVPVIEQMNRPGYTYLEFNRLARSDNAIVFVIIRDDTNREKKPESEVVSKLKE